MPTTTGLNGEVDDATGARVASGVVEGRPARQTLTDVGSDTNTLDLTLDG